MDEHMQGVNKPTDSVIGEIETPTTASARSHSTSRLLWLLVLIIAVSAIGAYAFKMIAPDATFFVMQPKKDGPIGEEAINVFQLSRSGQFQDALRQYETIVADPRKNGDEKALATLSTIGAMYHSTGDINARLVDIQNLKKIIRDEDANTSRWIRVAAINMLAGQHSMSGSDPAVIDEIYKDPPYSEFYVEGDARASARRLYEWSYSIIPTSQAAIALARWYSEQVVSNLDDLEQGVAPTNASMAEGYLKQAEELVVQEQQNDPLFVESGRYLVYRYWRAVVIGRLAMQIGEPYLGQYRKEYEDFIQYTQTEPHVHASEYRLYARMYYASHMSPLGEKADAKTQLDILAKEMAAVRNPDTSVFLRYLKNELTPGRSPAMTRLIGNLARLSPDFKVAVENLTGREIVID